MARPCVHDVEFPVEGQKCQGNILLIFQRSCKIVLLLPIL